MSTLRKIGILLAIALTACTPAALEPLPTLAPLITAPPTLTPIVPTPTRLIATAAGPSPTFVPTPADTPTPLIAPAPTPTPYTRLAPLVYHPPGTFIMGALPGADPYAEVWERPPHEVTLSGFWMETTEVSNARYALCVAAGVCSLPLRTSSRTRGDYYGNPAFAEYPMVNVTHAQAAQFCEWAGGRLPTEAEWEYAARFNDGRLYPWGNEQDLGRGQFGRGEGSDTEPVTAFPGGASALGVLNLAGNVWEWVADWYDAGYYAASPKENPTGPTTGKERAARGGAFATDPQFVRNTNRFSLNPERGYTNVGFRCVTTNPRSDLILLPTLTPRP